MYYLITEKFKSQEQKLVALIREAVEVHTIYMLGSNLATRRTETVFMPEAPSCQSANYYYLLVLINDDGDVNAAQDKIENRAAHFVPVTAMVMPVLTFTCWLAKGHPFAHKVYREAVLLYSQDEKLSAPEILPKGDMKNSDVICTDTINKVTEFMAGADLFILRNQTKLAAFMLHQAAEQCLHGLFEISTGMYLNTHSIDKLLRYCSMINWRLPEIIPRNNDKEEKLFQLLQKAYAGGRYEKEYSITVKDLEVLRGRIAELKEILQEDAKR